MILPSDKHYLIESLQKAIRIIEALPQRQECSICIHYCHGKCVVNNMMDIPENVKPKGCSRWEWDSDIPF